MHGCAHPPEPVTPTASPGLWNLQGTLQSPSSDDFGQALLRGQCHSVLKQSGSVDPVMAPPAAMEAHAYASVGGKHTMDSGRPVIIVEAVTAERTASSSSSASSSGSIPEHMRHIEIPELGTREVHPFHRPAQPTREEIRASPHYPVMVTPNPMVADQVGAPAWPRMQPPL